MIGTRFSAKILFGFNREPGDDDLTGSFGLAFNIQTILFGNIKWLVNAVQETNTKALHKVS